MWLPVFTELLRKGEILTTGCLHPINHISTVLLNCRAPYSTSPSWSQSYSSVPYDVRETEAHDIAIASSLQVGKLTGQKGLGGKESWGALEHLRKWPSWLRSRRSLQISVFFIWPLLAYPFLVSLSNENAQLFWHGHFWLCIWDLRQHEKEKWIIGRWTAKKKFPKLACTGGYTTYRSCTLPETLWALFFFLALFSPTWKVICWVHFISSDS